MRTSLSLLLLALVGAAVLTAAGCERKCRSADDCQRQCDCEDVARDRVIPCNVFFSCDVEKETCESDLTALTCEEICQRFATPINEAGDNLCGRRKCAVDRDCDKSVLCQTGPGPNGEPPQQFDCDVDVFVCEQDLGFCELAASASDDEICRELCAPPL